MTVNNLGLGLLLEAKDLATGVLQRYGATLLDVTGKSGKAAESIKSNMKAAGLGLSLFAAGMGGLSLLGPASEAATAFGFQIGRVRTVIDETALSTADAKRSTMELAGTYGILAGQQADSLYETISAGISDATKATDLLRVANEFAVGGTTGLAGSVDVLTSAVNTYADQGLTAQQASDLMFTAIAAGKTTAEQLSQSLGEVAPTAHAAGVSFAELQGAIAALTVQGIKTPQAVTGLNAMLSNLQKPSSDAAKEAKRLGIEFGATALKTMGLQGVLAQLAGNTKVNDETFVNLFGSIDGVKAALALTAGGGAKFNEVLDQMRTASGATRKAFEIMSNTTKFQEDRLAALKDNALILIGDALEPLKVSVLKFVNSAIEGFNKIPGPIRNFLVQGFAVVSVLLAVVGAGLAVKAALSMGMTALSALGFTAGGTMATLAPVAGTIALIGLALYGLKLAYDKNLGGFADKVNQVVADVRLGLSALGQLFEDGAFSGETMAQLNLAENSGIKAFAIEVFLIANRIKAFFEGIGTGFSKNLGVIQPALDNLLKSVQPIVDVFAKLFAGEGTDAAGAKFDRWAAAGERVGQVLAEIAGIAITTFSFITNLVSGIVVGVSRLGPVFEGVGGPFVELWQTLSDIGKELGLASDAGIGLGDVFFALGIGVAGVLGMLAGLVRGVVAALAGAIRSIATVVSGVVNIIGGIIDGDWSRVWLGARQVVFGVVQAVISVLGGLVEGIASAIDAVGAVIGKNLGAANTVKGVRTQLEKDARDFFGVPQPGGTPTPTSPAAAGAAASAGVTAAAAAVVQAQQFGPPTAAQAAAQKPTQVNVPVAVYLDGELVGRGNATRDATASGIPVTPAGV